MATPPVAGDLAQGRPGRALPLYLFKIGALTASILFQLRVGFRDRYVFLGPSPEAQQFLFGERPGHLGGRSQDHRARRRHEALGDERVRADDTMVPDSRAIEDGGAHADEAFVADLAGVDNRAVPDRAI